MKENNPIITPEYFIEAFTKLYKIHREEIKEKCKSATQLTNFYSTFFDEISNLINKETGLITYVGEKEYLTIDFTIFANGKNKYPVPIVCIESENNYNADIDNEVRKLLSVNAHLKVLVTRSNSFDVLDNNKLEEDTFWRYPIEDFHKHNLLNAPLIVMLLNTDDTSYSYKIYKKYTQKRNPFLIEDIKRIE